MNKPSEDDIRIEVYKSFTDDLSKRQMKDAEMYDKSLLTLSSAFLGLAVTFTKDVVPLANARWLFLMYGSWILFAMTIIITIFSFIYAQFIHNKLIKWAGDYILDGKQELKNKGERLGYRILYLNSFSGLVFIVAVVMLTSFVILNVNKNRSQNVKITGSEVASLSKEKTKQQEYQSPDGKYIAIVIPLPKAPYGSGESKIEIHSKDAIVTSATYSSEDGEHGFGVEQAAWSPDSKFFVYSMSSSGGHQAWHFPTYFVSVSDLKSRYLDDYVGSITQPEFTFTPPDIIQVYGHTRNNFEKETEIKASLSKLLKK